MFPSHCTSLSLVAKQTTSNGALAVTRGLGIPASYVSPGVTVGCRCWEPRAEVKPLLCKQRSDGLRTAETPAEDDWGKHQCISSWEKAAPRAVRREKAAEARQALNLRQPAQFRENGELHPEITRLAQNREPERRPGRNGAHQPVPSRTGRGDLFRLDFPHFTCSTGTSPSSSQTGCPQPALHLQPRRLPTACAGASLRVFAPRGHLTSWVTVSNHQALPSSDFLNSANKSTIYTRKGRASLRVSMRLTAGPR